jgi:hypothetical protein
MGTLLGASMMKVCKMAFFYKACGKVFESLSASVSLLLSTTKPAVLHTDVLASSVLT